MLITQSHTDVRELKRVNSALREKNEALTREVIALRQKIDPVSALPGT